MRSCSHRGTTEVDDLNQRARRRLILERQLGAYDLVVNGRGFASATRS